MHAEGLKIGNRFVLRHIEWQAGYVLGNGIRAGDHRQSARF